MQFSVIIPAKNEEANIGKCLDSINGQAWDKSQYEVIIVDNGSSDRTVEIARGKGATVYVKPELTISGLRNFGAGQAVGKILAFMDADCTVDSHWLSEAARYLDRDEVVCFGSPPVVPANATWVQNAWFLVRRKHTVAGETEWLESMNMFVRRDDFAKCGGFDEELVTCEDYDLSLRLKKFGLLLNDSRIVAVHHGEAATVGHFFRKEIWRGISNFRGLMQHGIILREIPSLIAPPAHCLLLAAGVLAPFFHRSTSSRAAFLLLLVWQLALLVLSLRKIERQNAPALAVQLYWLLNVYFLARGLAIFRGISRRNGTGKVVTRCAE